MTTQLQFYAVYVHPKGKPKDDHMWVDLVDKNWSLINNFQNTLDTYLNVFDLKQPNNVNGTRKDAILFRDQKELEITTDIIRARIWYGRKGIHEALIDGSTGQHKGTKTYKDFGIVPLFYQLKWMSGRKVALLGVQRTGQNSAAFLLKELLEECLLKKFPPESGYIVKVLPVHINWSTKTGFFANAKAKKIDITEFSINCGETSKPVAKLTRESSLTPYEGGSFGNFIESVLGNDLKSLPDDKTIKGNVISIFCPDEINVDQVKSIDVTFENNGAKRKIDFANFKRSGTKFDITEEIGFEPETNYPIIEDLKKICDSYMSDLFNWVR